MGLVLAYLHAVFHHQSSHLLFSQKMNTDRKPILTALIDSYLPQLTEEDLYKLHDLVRNTVISRQPILGEQANEFYPEEFAYLSEENGILVSDDDLPNSRSLSKSIFENTSLCQLSKVARDEIGRLGLNTAHYGVIVLAFSETKFQAEPEEGLDIFFGVRNMFDARLRLAWKTGVASIVTVDRQAPGSSELTIHNSTDKYTCSERSEASLLQGLQDLANRYHVAPKQQKP